MKRMTFQETMNKFMENAPEFFKNLHAENARKLIEYEKAERLREDDYSLNQIDALRDFKD